MWCFSYNVLQFSFWLPDSLRAKAIKWNLLFPTHLKINYGIWRELLANKKLAPGFEQYSIISSSSCHWLIITADDKHSVSVWLYTWIHTDILCPVQYKKPMCCSLHAVSTLLPHCWAERSRASNQTDVSPKLNKVGPWEISEQRETSKPMTDIHVNLIRCSRTLALLCETQFEANELNQLESQLWVTGNSWCFPHWLQQTHLLRPDAP